MDVAKEEPLVWQSIMLVVSARCVSLGSALPETNLFSMKAAQHP